jgi:NADPH-dependent 2,4-dienoyl-CoA reductase/sulfur reductase-like enzyme
MKIVILGNGISGITAARFVRKLSDHEIVVISRETDYFFSRTALMYLYMGHMRFKDLQPYEPDFWVKNRIDLLRAEVRNIDFDQKLLHFNPNFKPMDTELSGPPTSLSYDRLILALGSASNKFGWPGQELEGVQGLYSFQDVENMEKRSAGISRAVIVGGGLIGIEMAEMFRSRHIPVTMLVREKKYWDMVLPTEESEMVERQIQKHHIDLRLSTELKEIKGNAHGQVVSVVTGEDETIPCEFVGLTAGVHPNIRWLKETVLEVDRGILVNEYLETNIPDVYAVGDCVQIRNPKEGRSNIEAIWYTGRIMGEVVAHHVCGQKISYDPGIWFNSAKFFDIEYQVYGQVPVNLPDHMETLYWEDPKGERSIRLVFGKESGIILGFNLMGIRLRQEVCEKWIHEKTPIEKVLEDISLASFDPEFYPKYYKNIIQLYNRKSDRDIPDKRKRRFDLVSIFLNR